jgi:3-dehydroquinate synthase
MKQLLVSGAARASRLLVGASIDTLGEHIDGHRTIIITDRTVEARYRDRLPECPVITIGEGEQIKTLDTVAEIYRQLVELEADIAGFVASTYMRGIRFGFVSTTLLSQVDASVGGKNGVNFGGYKNMVGTFSQPEFVICDMAMLKTLPLREVLCGFAEIIKYGAIASAAMLDFLETHRDMAMELDTAIIAQLVYQSVEIKADVVTRDEREQGERRKLNFGHTFGHALEKLTGMPHGEAVAIGMVMAARLSFEKGFIDQRDADRLERLITSYGLPVQAPVDGEAVLGAMRKDKKRDGQKIHFVFLSALGSARVEDVDLDDLYRLAKVARVF